MATTNLILNLGLARRIELAEAQAAVETAEALELSVPAVKSRLLRARLQLRDKLTAFFKKKVEDPFAYL